MNIPYNTGKVKIGQYYQKPAASYVYDVDMMRLQTALIKDTKKLRKNALIHKVCLTVSILVFLGIVLLSKGM